MTEGSQYVDEAMDVLFALEKGQTSTLSPFLFQAALEALGPAHPQICGPLKRDLTHPDDMNVRFKVLEMLAKTGAAWVRLYGLPFADEVVLSMADSNLMCAACAGIAVQSWEHDGAATTQLLSWGKRHTPGNWDVNSVEAVHLPTVRQMLADLPGFEERIKLRRELPNSSPSLENNIRLWGRLKGMMLSVFNRG